MVNSCAVCDENKKGLSVFHFPKKLKRDWELEVLKVLKIKDLKIKDFVSTSSSVLCEIHFQEDDFKKQVIDGSEQNTTRKRLKSDAVPTMWPGFPMYLSKPKPITSLNADKLLKIWKNVAKVLTEIGFNIVVTTVDGMRTNVSFYNKLADLSSRALYELFVRNPFDLNKLIFLTFDTTHLFKNFYNNFNTYKEFHFPVFPVQSNECPLIARFSDLKQLYDLELRKPEKIAYKLSEQMLFPNSIEKTNVQLAHACFHDSTISGLLYYAEKQCPHFKDTATFLKIIRHWFNVMNVKTKFDAQKNRDDRRKCVTVENRDQLNFLQQFYTWLETWSATKQKGLSDLTFHASKVTTVNFIKLANHVLDDKENDIEYITFGSISQDFLEGRFGWFRQLSGGNYYNSTAQFVQAEKKIRLRSLVKMGFVMPDIKEIFQDCEILKQRKIDERVNEILAEMVNFSFGDNSLITSTDEMIVFYTSGAIVRGLKGKTTCNSCKEMLTRSDEILTIEDDEDVVESERKKLVDMVNRGGLHKPIRPNIHDLHTCVESL